MAADSSVRQRERLAVDALLSRSPPQLADQRRSEASEPELPSREPECLREGSPGREVGQADSRREPQDRTSRRSSRGPGLHPDLAPSDRIQRPSRLLLLVQERRIWNLRFALFEGVALTEALANPLLELSESHAGPPCGAPRGARRRDSSDVRGRRPSRRGARRHSAGSDRGSRAPRRYTRSARRTDR